jgi:putative ABC transport system substrate-binding protein
MMDRRAFLATMASSLLAAPVAAAAQQAARVPRIGVIIPQAPPPAAQPWLDAFREGLRQQGYVEGKTILLEVRWLAGRASQGEQTDLVSRLIRLPVDVIVVNTTGAAYAAQQATTTIPIVTAAAGALIEAGVVASLARPGGNVTGLTTQGVDLSAKRLELLTEVLPRLADVAALESPYEDTAGRDLYRRYTEAGARAVGVQLQILEVKTPEELDGAFRAATRSRAGAVITLPNTFFVVHAARVAQLALEHRLPLAAYYREEVDAGALMWYGVNRPDMWRRAAIYVDKLLKGAKPGELPIERPTKFELVINLKTAKALGLVIPPSLMQRADQVIE